MEATIPIFISKKIEIKENEKMFYFILTLILIV